MTRPDQLADALFQIAKANHYMVGLVEPVSQAELDVAELILIARQAGLIELSAEYETIGLALDMIEQKIIKVKE